MSNSRVVVFDIELADDQYELEVEIRKIGETEETTVLLTATNLTGAFPHVNLEQLSKLFGEAISMRAAEESINEAICALEDREDA